MTEYRFPWRTSRGEEAGEARVIVTGRMDMIVMMALKCMVVGYRRFLT
jgi:hypothetical protein